MLHNIFRLFIFLFVEALPLNQYLVFTHNIWTSAITLFRTATVAHSSCYTLQFLKINFFVYYEYHLVDVKRLLQFVSVNVDTFCDLIVSV